MASDPEEFELKMANYNSDVLANLPVLRPEFNLPQIYVRLASELSNYFFKISYVKTCEENMKFIMKDGVLVGDIATFFSFIHLRIELRVARNRKNVVGTFLIDVDGDEGERFKTSRFHTEEYLGTTTFWTAFLRIFKNLWANTSTLYLINKDPEIMSRASKNYEDFRPDEYRRSIISKIPFPVLTLAWLHSSENPKLNAAIRNEMMEDWEQYR